MDEHQIVPNRYESFNGLRALAAIAIVVMHYYANARLELADNYFTKGVLPRFSTFVVLFFIISAFSMCCGYYQRLKDNKITLSAFYQKRYKRLLPFFGLMTCIDLAFRPSLNSLYEAFANFTLCFGLLPNPKIEVIGVGWFIGVLFVFYLLFPFFVYLIENKRKAWFVFLITIALNFIIINYFYTDKFVNIRNLAHTGDANILYMSPYFVVGGLVYLYREKLSQIVNKSKIATFLFLVVVLVAWCLVRDLGISRFCKVLTNIVAGFTFLLNGLTVKNILFDNKIAKYLSDISLEIYLSHMFMFRVVTIFIDKVHLNQYIVNDNLMFVFICVAGLAGSIIFSHIIHYQVFTFLGKKISFFKN